MALSSDLISAFVKATKDTDKTKTETTKYGVVVEHEGTQYVKLDGSDLLTPVQTTTVTKAGERVSVLIKNHVALVTGNLSNPSASDSDVKELGSKISEFEIIIADKVTVDELDAERARIDNLVADNVAIKDTLSASNVIIDDLVANNVTIDERLTATEADIKNLEATKLSANVADITYATIKELEATNADIYNLEVTYGEFAELTTGNFEAVNATIKNLDSQYANIDFSNIGQAAMEYFYSKSGLIENVTVGNQTITGNLVGVTIKGDLIEAGTLVAEKLVIQGEDGLYYKLNTDGETIEANQTDYNSLNGKIITAKSVTADKVSVTDLVAFDATIGGFNITDSSLYSGVKESVNNTTRGIYLDKEGQFAIGDAQNYLKYYKDTDGNYKLDISAKSISIGTSGGSVESVLDDLQTELDNVKDEILTSLYIESSRGTVFKNDDMSTVLSVVIYHGSQRITDSTTMKEVFGASAYLQWKWQRVDEDTYGVISSSDSRFGNDYFTFTLSPEDIDTKVTFVCELIT